jgi:hypothetical protein
VIRTCDRSATNEGLPRLLGDAPIEDVAALGAATVDIVAPSGALLVTHRLAPAGAGSLVRTPEHHTQLEAAVLSAFTTAPPCDRKANHPPGAAAQAEAARLIGAAGDDADVTVDLAVYERAARSVS